MFLNDMANPLIILLISKTMAPCCVEYHRSMAGEYGLYDVCKIGAECMWTELLGAKYCKILASTCLVISIMTPQRKQHWVNN